METIIGKVLHRNAERRNSKSAVRLRVFVRCDDRITEDTAFSDAKFNQNSTLNC